MRLFKWFLSRVLFMPLIWLPFYVNAENTSTPELLQYLLQLDNKDSVGATSELKGIKKELLQRKGTLFGMHGGKYFAMGKYEQYLKNKSELLNLNFDIKPLMINYHGFLIDPPEINQIKEKRVLGKNGKQIRYAETIYEIIKQPKFVHHHPDWEDYIHFERTKPEIRHLEILPNKDNEEEVEIWQQAVKAGWLDGIKQAEKNVITQIALMGASVQGKINYHLLKDRNMVSEPEVNRQMNEVMGAYDQMAINNIIVTITVNPKMQTNRFKWKALPELPSLEHIFPQHSFHNYGW